MIQMFLEGKYNGIELHHVRMNFSESLDEVGKVKLGKIFHLVSLILQIYLAKIRFRPSVLYYPPAGPNKVPLLRDAAILLATRLLFRHTVYHFQASGCSQLIPKLPSPFRQIVYFALCRPQLAIELSEYAAPDGSYLKARKIVRIPNAAPDESARFRAIPNSGEMTTNRTRILYLGTMCEEKGSFLLLQACGEIFKTRDDFHVDFVGGFQSEEYRRKIEEEIQRLGLNGYVTIHGQKVGDEKWQMFADADLFCFPSHYASEGFPCVLVEAMSFALPVVSTTWRGIPSIVSEGVTGYLVPPHDLTALTARLLELISSPELRHQLGTAGRRRYENEFTDVAYRKSMEEAILGRLEG